MRKVITAILCIAICFQMTACSLTKEDNQWIEEGAAKLDADLRSGAFVLDGEVYSFPMELADWLDNGWHVSNNYENKDEFTLEPGSASNEFELFNEDKQYVRVSVFNVSNEEVTVDKCMVASLYISLPDFEIVFPGGITKSSKPADIKAAYGEPDMDDSESGTFEGIYNYTSSDGWSCTATIHAFDNSFTIDPFSSIEYELVDDSANWNRFLTDEGGAEATIKYVDAAMRASYYGDYADYVLYYDTEENAEDLYETELEIYADCLMYYTDINTAYADDAVWDAFTDVAKQVLAKTSWEITLIDFDEEQLTGTMEITLYPTDFLEIIEDDVLAAIDEFQTKYADLDYNSLTENQISEIEQEYTDLIFNAISKNVSETQAAAPITKTYPVDFNGSVLSSDNWTEIDNVIMGIAE